MPLPSTKRHLEAFNDLALQWVDSNLLSTKPESFWDVADMTSAESLNIEEDPCIKTERSVVSGTKLKQDQLERDLIAALSRTSLS